MAALREGAGLPTCRGADLERLASVSLGWFAVRAWGLLPERQAIPGYAEETRRHVATGVESRR
jgi:hypothetical protein